MATKKTKAEEKPERDESATMPATAPMPTVTGVPAAKAARVRIGADPKRMSKGQRKHLRRQKEAGEIKVTPRR